MRRQVPTYLKYLRYLRWAGMCYVPTYLLGKDAKQRTIMLVAGMLPARSSFNKERGVGGKGGFEIGNGWGDRGDAAVGVGKREKEKGKRKKEK